MMNAVGAMLMLAQAERPPLEKYPVWRGSTYAGDIDNGLWFITILCIIFFVLIVGLMLYFMWKYRRKSHVTETGGATHNTPLEVGWTVLPLILVIVIFYVGMKYYVNLRKPPLTPYTVYVTAAKWQWSFDHPNGASDPLVLDIPANRPVKLIMTSNDVLHAMFIPAFRAKQDIVPGRLNTIWFEATARGEYDLFCAEYCGEKHSQMVAHVNVWDDGDEFEQVMLEKSQIWDDDELAPAQIFAQKVYPRCVACHSLDGSPGTGPTFKGLWDKLESGTELFEGGKTAADLIGPGKQFDSVEAYIADSIMNPQSVLVRDYPGSMPRMAGQRPFDKPIAYVATIEFLKYLDHFDPKTKELIKPLPMTSGGAESTESSDETSASAPEGEGH